MVSIGGLGFKVKLIDRFLRVVDLRTYSEPKMIARPPFDAIRH